MQSYQLGQHRTGHVTGVVEVEQDFLVLLGLDHAEQLLGKAFDLVSLEHRYRLEKRDHGDAVDLLDGQKQKGGLACENDRDSVIKTYPSALSVDIGGSENIAEENRPVLSAEDERK